MVNLGSTTWSGYHADKDALRSEIWSRLKQAQAAVGEPFGHIPNFRGAEQAAEQLTTLPVWQQAQVVKWVVF